MQTESQLSLPYLEIKEVAGRSFLRENFTITSKVSYKVELSKIKERDGFNQRIEYAGIEELADSIFNEGLLEPLTLDVLPDGTCYIDKGHRRYRALIALVKQERIDVDYLVEFFPNKASITEEDRMAHQYTSNNHQFPLKPIEQAKVAYCLKYHFGSEKSNEEIAARMGVSRQKVDNLILFAEQPDDVKDLIQKEGLKFTKAVEYIRNRKTLEKQADKAEEVSLRTSTHIPEVKDELAEDIKELDTLEKEVTLAKSEQDDELLEIHGEHIGDHIEASPSVITVSPTIEEKPKYDSSREEIAQIQNIIKLVDKIDHIASKIPDGQTSKDITDICRWIQKDAELVREWIHKNKKQNKIR